MKNLNEIINMNVRIDNTQKILLYSKYEHILEIYIYFLFLQNNVY